MISPHRAESGWLLFMVWPERVGFLVGYVRVGLFGRNGIARRRHWWDWIRAGAWVWGYLHRSPPLRANQKRPEKFHLENTHE